MTLLLLQSASRFAIKKHPAQLVSYTIFIHLSWGTVVCYPAITGQVILPILIIGRYDLAGRNVDARS